MRLRDSSRRTYRLRGRSYTRGRLSPGEEGQSEGDAAGAPAPAGTPERPALRTRPFGYRKGDVHRALDARDAELTELKQDIAALWLAFAQHDRMIRGETPAPTPALPEAGPGPAESSQDREWIDSEAGSIGAQLTELDEVLAAIEMATRTLEGAYADEIEASRESGRDVSSSGSRRPSDSGRSESSGTP